MKQYRKNANFIPYPTHVHRKHQLLLKPRHFVSRILFRAVFPLNILTEFPLNLVSLPTDPCSIIIAVSSDLPFISIAAFTLQTVKLKYLLSEWYIRWITDWLGQNLILILPRASSSIWKDLNPFTYIFLASFVVISEIKYGRILWLDVLPGVSLVWWWYECFYWDSISRWFACPWHRNYNPSVIQLVLVGYSGIRC